MKKFIVAVCVFFQLALVFSQNFVSVPLDDEVYFILENAQIRGLCSPLSGAKPYSRDVVLNAIDEILSSEVKGFAGLTEREREVLMKVRSSFETPEEGWDWERFAYFGRESFSDDFETTLDLALSWDSFLTVTDSPRDFGTTNFGTISVSGDLGNSFSYDFNLSAGALSIDRKLLQEAGNSDYPGLDGVTDVDIYEVTPYFPYTFTKMWDSAIFKLSNLAAYNNWPSGLSFGYVIESEMDLSLWDNRVSMRFGRLRRESGAMTNGGSLVLNGTARPFLGIDMTFRPMSWFELSSVTGVLEYFNRDGLKGEGLKGSSKNKQAAYTNTMLEFRYKNYFHFDFGSTVIWSKRFELGYLFPINSDFFYQNNIGDFDNLGLFANGFVQWPGVGKLWGSLFVDEFNLKSKPFFNLDRNMYAFQTGLQANIPWLPFATFTAKYTKIEPYCYTHPFTDTPYSDYDVDTDYTNNGEGLGYYLDPNSDEILVRLETMPVPGMKFHGQYQMIRHGADFGYLGVDGSSYDSSMNYSNLSATKYFLLDGAYEWFHIFKAGGVFSLKLGPVPVDLFGEAGFVYSYFTKPDGTSGKFVKFEDNVYETSKRMIFSFGFTLYP